MNTKPRRLLRIDVRGRINIPADILTHLQLRVGDSLRIEEEGSRIILIPLSISDETGTALSNGG